MPNEKEFYDDDELDETERLQQSLNDNFVAALRHIETLLTMIAKRLDAVEKKLED